MNVYEWVLSAAVVLLWLYALSVKHRVEVLRGECSRWSNEAERDRVLLARELRGTDAMVESLFEALSAKADKPLLRRKTDKKPDDEWTICCKPPKKAKR